MPTKTEPEKLLKSLQKDVLSNPSQFLLPSEPLSSRLLSVSKWIFDAAKKHDPYQMSPLPELHVDGFDMDQVWEQIQLQNGPMMEYLKGSVGKLFPGVGFGKKGGMKRRREEEEDAEDDDVEDDEEDGDEEDEDFEEDEGVDLEDEEDTYFDEDADLEEGDDEENDELESEEAGLEEEEEGDEEEDDEDDDEEDDLDEGLPEDLDDDAEEGEGAQDIEDDEDEDPAAYNEDDEANGDREEAKPRRGRWTPLDDEFFSLEEMERFAEMGEAKDLSRENKDVDETTDDWSLGLGYLGMDPDQLNGSDDEDEMNANEIRYEDFFAPPAKLEKGFGQHGRFKRGVRFNEEVQEKRFRKDKRWGDDEDEDEEEHGGEFMDAGDDDEEDDDALKRTTKNIFELEEDDDKSGLSKFERQQQMISNQISQLEDEMVAEKPWALKGEVNSKARPVNSLLEEDLEVEHASRPAPVVTEETTLTLEDMIKQRVKDAVFDDVERKLAPREKTYDPNRKDIIDEQKSSKSLAEVYEDEYMSKQGGEKIKTAREEKVEAAHKEIDELWVNLMSSLDALANYSYSPDAPKIEMEIVPAPNVAAITIEEIIPASVSDAKLAAPEEVYEGKSGKSKSEMTSKDKKKARSSEKKRHKRAKLEKEKEIKAREAEKVRAGTAIKVGVTKDKAMEQLLKQKNVTIVADGKRGKGSANEAAKVKGKGKVGKNILANVVERGGKLGDKGGAGKTVRPEFLRL
ncbi:u3 small nucleolar ribonucleoprotein MPP10 [Phlyctochytrium planicorne]|nr:u3 small nucleolar ribonucleoprotein MPP10 [Phlyctochytrium planicorne]